MSQAALVTEDMLARQPPEAQTIIRALLVRMSEQDRRIAVLEAELAAAKKTPRNSSCPPSSEHPHAKPPRDQRAKESKKQRGGQPGHPKHERALIPTEQCQAVVPLKPETCRRCAETLVGTDPEPLRHQVWDIPEIKPLVTEYQLHRLTCPRCQESTCAQLPAGVPASQAGARQVKRLGHDLMRCTRDLFRQWSRCRDGTITYTGLQRLMRPIRRRVEDYLLRGLFSGNSTIVGMCQELYKHRDWLWTFLEIEGVEPTNNASERALRHAVIWRKLSFGTQSAHGSRFVATILTVVETCRQQSRSVFDYLTTAMQDHFAHEPAPSLLAEV